MPNRVLKLFMLAAFCAGGLVYGLNGIPVRAYASGPEGAKTGAPGESNCTECHFGSSVNSGSGTLSINGVPATYSPNQEVSVTVTLGQAGRSRFGFQLTAIDDQGRRAGTLVVTDGARMLLGQATVNGNQRQYINHTFAGTSAGGASEISWTFTWRAPAQSVGRVTFYAAGNAANNNDGQTGDLIYTKNVSANPAAVLTSFASVSAASFSQTLPTAAEAILAGFGTGLSQGVVVAQTTPLPTQLDGTEVLVRDSTNTERAAGLFFVSPGQINYLAPAGTANGPATVTVRRDGSPVSQGTITVDTAGPGLFTANANGQGVPAAVLFRRRNNVDTTEPIALLNTQTNLFSPIPIDLGPSTDIVALIVFGTGFRGAQQSTVTGTIGGTAAQVLFTGAQGSLAGLDQANLLIPPSLAGRGLVDVVLTVNGKAANTVQINIK
ncbi:MAG: choice-of-anchor V domain-containing protein [Blastocatellia bacterium]|nr:choice-of-anchor V domain-containing protein [Blastocatellia bacterium]